MAVLPRVPRSRGRSVTGPAGPSGAHLAEALLSADEDTASVLERLAEQQALVRFHREELHQTNQGVLALHAELDAAALKQRELLDAERTARSEAENARRLLTFLADASAAVTATLDTDDILRRLTELLVPGHAGRVDTWILDDERPSRPADRPAAAVTAVRTGRPQHAAPTPAACPESTTCRPPLRPPTGRCCASPSSPTRSSAC